MLARISTLKCPSVNTLISTSAGLTTSPGHRREAGQDQHEQDTRGNKHGLTASLGVRQDTGGRWFRHKPRFI